MIKLLAVLLAVFVSGCVQVRSTVTTFHTLSPSDLGKTVAVFPGSAEEQKSLERRAYVIKLEQHFAAAGYPTIPFDSPQQPDYVAVFTYGIDNGTQVTQSYSIPQWGVTGYSGAVTTGTVNSYGGYGTYNATTTYTPQYGVTGYDTGTTTGTVYGRAVFLTLYDTHKVSQRDKSSFDGAKVYEGKLTSKGSCGQIAGVIDPLLDALFKEFPGENGKARTIEVPMKDNSGC